MEFKKDRHDSKVFWCFPIQTWRDQFRRPGPIGDQVSWGYVVPRLNFGHAATQAIIQPLELAG
jgi:hypothetical protein